MADAPGDIEKDLCAMIVHLLPDVVQTSKYGGTLFHDPGRKAEDSICGVFAYAAHVSLAFSAGADLPDPEGILQGKGKRRRHVKFTTCSEATGQTTADLISHAAQMNRDRGI